MSTLFQIGEDAQALMSILEELEGDISDPAVAEAIDAWLTENQQDLNTKLDGYGALMAELDARAAARERGMDINSPPDMRDAINRYFRDKYGSGWVRIKSRSELSDVHWMELLQAVRDGVWNQSWGQVLFVSKNGRKAA